MQQAKFSLTPPLIDFLGSYKRYGFKDKSSMVRAALLHLQEEIEQESLKQSADLYAELYAEDSDLFDLTEAAVAEWPE
jgi:Arc/MetJ-type ribon-helix-helix transcriptional regulator